MRSKFICFYFFCFTIGSSWAQNPFITTWKTNTENIPYDTSITILTVGPGYNYDVDWNNDGIFDQIGITGNVSHSFGVPGTYKVGIRGAFPRIYFNNAPEKDKILEINQWGDIVWQSMKRAFMGCINLKELASDAPNLTEVTDLSNMFFGCISLNQDISNWNTQNITNMSGMFMEASTFNQSLNNWNTQSVTDMSSMFYHATSFNQSISNWDTKNVTNMSKMFYGKYNTGSSFNQPLNSWNTQNVTDMSYMFYQAISFNQPLSNWNTQNVFYMNSMFSRNVVFNQSLSNWNTQNVIDMGNMFDGATLFNQPVNNWKTQNVRSLFGMFSGASSFNQPISNWNTQSVFSMGYMFYSAQNFNQSMGNWSLKNVSDIREIIYNTNIDCNNYASTLIGWANNPDTPNGKSLGASGRQYGMYAVIARNILTGKGWTVTGDNLTADANCNCTNMYTVNSGNWNDATTWSCGRVPTAVDEVQIKSPNVIIVSSNQTFTVKNILIEPDSTLDLKDGAIIILSN